MFQAIPYMRCYFELFNFSGVIGISRVMYDLTDKPPGTTEWE